jgi:pilus assembly protein CpaD
VTDMTQFHIRKATLRAVTVALLSTALGACAGGIPTNRGLESVHQPVVERTNYTLDVTTGPGGLSVPEQRRLSGWFEAMNLRYGDRISIDDPLTSDATRSAVEAVAGRYGLLVGDQAPVTQGYVNAGTARIVVTRSTARVPGCPDWGGATDFNPNNATSPNFGCATNGNIAAMVANPEHLLHGEAGTGETTVMSSTKAIDSYRNATPTGEAGLKATPTQGGN